jgi:hypothetical protein
MVLLLAARTVLRDDGLTLPDEPPVVVREMVEGERGE